MLSPITFAPASDSASPGRSRPKTTLSHGAVDPIGSGAGRVILALPPLPLSRRKRAQRDRLSVRSKRTSRLNTAVLDRVYLGRLRRTNPPATRRVRRIAPRRRHPGRIRLPGDEAVLKPNGTLLQQLAGRQLFLPFSKERPKRREDQV